MLGTFVDRAWTVQELGIVGVVGVLSARSIDGVDRVFRPTAVILPTSRALQVIIALVLTIIRAMVMLIMAEVAVIMAMITIIIAPFFAMIVMTALGAIGMGGPFSFFGVSIAVCYLYQLTDGCRPLAV